MNKPLYRGITLANQCSHFFIDEKKWKKIYSNGKKFDKIKSKEITPDFEDTIAQPVDNIIVQGDNENIKTSVFL